MKNQALTTYVIALNNLRRKSRRSAALIFLVALFAFMLFSGSILIKSLENGLNSLSDRLGADIMAVPYGYEAKLQEALLRGEPSTFYFNSGVAEAIAGVEGVQRTSPQIYVATLRAGCCSYPIQLIGYDPETDFIIRPWVSSMVDPKLADGDIYVGSSINAEPGQELQFFGLTFRVAARLDKTGMGFDTSVFMSLDTARKAAREAERLQQNPLAQDANLISSVMIRLANGYDVKEVANRILQAYALDGVHVVVAKNVISDVSGSLQGLTVYVAILAGILGLVSVIVLVIVFSVTFAERKREFSLYRVLGATKRKLAGIVLMEAVLIGLAGALSGIAAAALVVFPFSMYIQSVVGLPYLQPSAGMILLIGGICFLISFLTGPLSSLYTVLKLGKFELYTAIRENE